MRSSLNKTERNISGNAWIKSLIINIIIFVTARLLTPIMYETNDDFSIALEIGDQYPYVGFLDFLVCKIMIAIQKVLPSWNIFIISQILFSFIAFVVILKVVINRSHDVMIDITAVAAIAVFSLDHYSSVQFTKSSVLIMTAGLLLVVDNFLHERKQSPFILGYFLIYMGAAYREEGLLPEIAYAGIFLILWAILNKFEGFGQCRTRGGEVALIIVLVLAAFGPYAVDAVSDNINRSTDELRTAAEYQDARAAITDRPTYKYYKENAEAYTEAGFSENDIYLVSHWVLDTEGAASYENLRTIAEIKTPSANADKSVVKVVKKCIKNTLTEIRNQSFSGIHVMLIIVLALLLIASIRPGKWWYVIGICGLEICIYIMLYYIQRPQYRAFYVGDIGAAVWLLYTLSMEYRASGTSKRSLRLVASLAVLTAIFLLIPAWNNLESQHASILKKIQSDTITEFYADNEDNLYISFTSEKKRNPSYATPLAAAVSEKNAKGTGGWKTLTPIENKQLAEYGVSNCIADLIDNDKCFFIGNKNIDRLEEYYNKWYGDSAYSIELQEVGTVDKKSLWKIVKVEQ